MLTWNTRTIEMKMVANVFLYLRLSPNWYILKYGRKQFKEQWILIFLWFIAKIFHYGGLQLLKKKKKKQTNRDEIRLSKLKKKLKHQPLY